VLEPCGHLKGAQSCESKSICQAITGAESRSISSYLVITGDITCLPKRELLSRRTVEAIYPQSKRYAAREAFTHTRKPLNTSAVLVGCIELLSLLE